MSEQQIHERIGPSVEVPAAPLYHLTRSGASWRVGFELALEGERWPVFGPEQSLN